MLTIIPCDLFITNIMSVIPNIDCHEFMRFILFWCRQDLCAKLFAGSG